MQGVGARGCREFGPEGPGSWSQGVHGVGARECREQVTSVHFMEYRTPLRRPNIWREPRVNKAVYRAASVACGWAEVVW